MSEKKILDATCGSRSIWFNKHHPAAVYMDKRQEYGTRIWKSGDGLSERTLNVDPDVIADFTAIPFESNTFYLVVFDPPHLLRAGETAWLKNTANLMTIGRKCLRMDLRNACEFYGQTEF